MKKLVCLLLTLLLCGCMAAAETAPEIEHAFTTETETIDQDCYVLVQLVFEQPAEQTKEIVLQVKAFTVQYLFELYKDPADGSYSGFRYGPENVVNVNMISAEEEDLFLPLLDLTAEVKEMPRNYSFVGRPDDYSLQIMGGSLELSYNKVLYFDLTGKLTKVTPTTEKRAFFYSNIPYQVVTEQK